MNGYEATFKMMEALRLEQNKPNRRENIDYFKYHTIIALTSFTGRDVDEKCRSLGMKEVLQKPVSAETLYAVLNKYFYN